MAGDYVTLLAGGKITGDVLTLDGTIQTLSDIGIRTLSVMLRPGGDNAGTVYIYNSGGDKPTMFLDAGDSPIVYDVANPQLIKVRGTADDILYWSAVMLPGA